MNDKIKEIADKIAALVDKGEWTKADRLQKVLEQLVKLEISAIRGESHKGEETI